MNYLCDFISLASFLWLVATVLRYSVRTDCNAKIVICKHTDHISINYFAKTNMHAPLPNVAQVSQKRVIIATKRLQILPNLVAWRYKKPRNDS